jgi:preprotein translocase subunit SecF
MRRLRLVPDNTKIDFVGQRVPAFILSVLLMLVGVGSLLTQGLNMGIDFRGGVLIDASYMPEGQAQAVDVSALRGQLGGLNLGEVALQTFGQDNTVLIRLQQQTGGDTANAQAVQTVKAALGEGWSYNRVESVGPTVGRELLIAGFTATCLALLGVAAYVMFRFEWQFGVSTLASTFHDVFVSLGLISLLGLEFNLTTMAALLLLAGYSINDTVIVFDRIRENMRRYKSAPMADVINMSVNATLGRTFMTSGTTMLAILPMLFFGGDTLFGFTAVIVWGVVVGTFSSVYVASSLLLYMPEPHLGRQIVTTSAAA